MESVSIDSCVQGYHVYNAIWEAGEELLYQREDGNAADPYAIRIENTISWLTAPLIRSLYNRESCSAGRLVMRSTAPTAEPCACAPRSGYVSLIFVGGNFRDC